MPRCIRRITLNVTDVRVERLKYLGPRLPVSRQPGPIPFTFQHTLTREWRYRYDRDPQYAVEMVRRLADSELADLILEKCAFFHKDYFKLDEPAVRIELTVNDRGAYERIVFNERYEAAAKETKRVTKVLTESLPYGLAEAAQEFYEYPRH